MDEWMEWVVQRRKKKEKGQKKREVNPFYGIE